MRVCMNISQIDACSPSASTHDLAEYFALIAQCFSAYYNVYVDKFTQAAVQVRSVTALARILPGTCAGGDTIIDSPVIGIYR